jgi:hypothetical protein
VSDFAGFPGRVASKVASSVSAALAGSSLRGAHFSLMALIAWVLGVAGLVLARVSEASATEGVIVASIVVPILILAVVGWFFWRASNRDRRTDAR